MDLKVGDIVQLKTGGPMMTVNRVGPFTKDPSSDAYLEDGEVEAIWFNEQREHARAWEYVCTHRFGAEALKKVADQYNRARLTPFAAWGLRTWLRWVR